MHVETHDRLGDPKSQQATRLVVYDAHRNPVAVFIQVAPNHLFCRFKGQPDFDAALSNLGVRDTTITDIVRAEDLQGAQV